MYTARINQSYILISSRVYRTAHPSPIPLNIPSLCETNPQLLNINSIAKSRRLDRMDLDLGVIWNQSERRRALLSLNHHLILHHHQNRLTKLHPSLSFLKINIGKCECADEYSTLNQLVRGGILLHLHFVRKNVTRCERFRIFVELFMQRMACSIMKHLIKCSDWMYTYCISNRYSK